MLAGISAKLHGRGLAVFLAAWGCVGLAPVRSWAAEPAPPAKTAAAVEALPPDHAAKMARGLETYKKSVRALLVQHCVKCHGGDHTEGSFDLTTRAGLLKGGDTGPGVVPFKSADSLLQKLVTHQEEPHMPHEAGKLPAAEIAQIAEWIDLGAAYDGPLLGDKDKTPWTSRVVAAEARDYWAFRPLGRPTPPTVRDESWVRTPADRFILAALDAKGIKPNAEADRRTLLRRTFFDLIGLPPTPEETAAFLDDPSPRAYENLIERLLASPHFGERWGRHWLDVARFAESHGYEQDYDRPNAYHFRDFVIQAFNEDLPFATFVRWQLAGDEFAPDNPLALKATGFLAAGTHATQITASQVEKERYDELDDKLRTTGTAFLGLTVGCSRCHDHKYDPIPMRDYYRMLATFTTTVRSDFEVELDPRGFAAAKAAFDAEQARLVTAVKEYEAKTLSAKLDAWLASRPKEPPPAKWIVIDPVEVKSQGGATLTKLGDGSLLAGGKNPDFDAYTFVAHTPLIGVTALKIEALAHPSLVKGGPGRADNGNIDLTDVRVSIAPRGEPGKTIDVKLTNAQATFEQNNGALSVKAAIDGDRKSGWAVDPQFGKDHAAVFETVGEVGFPGGSILTITLEFSGNNRHNIGRPRLSLSTAPRPVGLDGDGIPSAVSEALAVADAQGPAKLTTAQRDALLAWIGRDDPRWRELQGKVAAHAKQSPQPKKTKILIASEGVPAVRTHTQGGDFLEHTHFLTRGNPNLKEEVAPQSFLQVLMPSVDAAAAWQSPPPVGWRTSYRRRAMAEWITDVDRGAGALLARVIVNRLWQHHMGRGIVGTPSDFGKQGDPPTHPELLEYLARELVEHNWSLKHVHRLIMSSAVYRQSSNRDAEREKVDLANRLWWRRTPRRLEAEVIRDAMLSVAGELDRTLYGPGTMDPNHKRRSIYFFVKRSKLTPMMVLFDAPDTLGGLDRRVTTTVAPQSLLMMNNATIRTMAETLARRVAPQSTTPPAEAVRAAMKFAVARQPSDRELAEVTAALAEQTAAYQAEGKPEPARLALADYCQVLFMLNEFVYVD